jgi:GTP cyclohydrolase I
MKVTVAYIPEGKVIGLSKIARIADMVAKRLQIQERIGSDIAEIISEATGSDSVAVKIEGYHSCMTARGIKRQNAKHLRHISPVASEKNLFCRTAYFWHKGEQIHESTCFIKRRR